ncbi:MAG TPA: KEOPS complex subunit Pcc1 [Methanospirillum sp.]|uniref:KEOPS complex subunit Pcc1 n=1 Tax=Methanospirillum sp. TaxID=45200 RepID=UPI002CA1AB2D|nr:KEOPS complex subunit Pcc1 [Methanospirillum sp.]HOJ96156.1 KEOPS complex subunit Pcc1 [Methanospirillum sp.]
MKHEAVFTFDTPDAGVIAASLVPESDNGEIGRSRGSVHAVSDTSFQIQIQADDLTALRAALNTWLRLVQIAEEMVQTTKKAGRTNE